MTSKLSNAFFGNKKFTQKVYEAYIKNPEFTTQNIKIIFEPYTSKIESIRSADNSVSLLDIYAEFLKIVWEQFQDWEFQKFSSILEIAAHTFQYSFQKWLTKQQSYRYFSDVLVRHSLFRPPHTVNIFNYEQLKLITKFWIKNFVRYYQQYKQCLSSQLNQILICSALPQDSHFQSDLKEGKSKNKSQIQQYLLKKQ